MPAKNLLAAPIRRIERVPVPGDWGRVFGDAVDYKRTAAILDRLIHNAVVFNIKGPSWRLKDHEPLTTALTDRDERRPS